MIALSQSAPPPPPQKKKNPTHLTHAQLLLPKTGNYLKHLHKVLFSGSTKDSVLSYPFGLISRYNIPLLNRQ